MRRCVHCVHVMCCMYSTSCTYATLLIYSNYTKDVQRLEPTQNKQQPGKAPVVTQTIHKNDGVSTLMVTLPAP